jgi:mannosyltransferase
MFTQRVGRVLAFFLIALFVSFTAVLNISWLFGESIRLDESQSIWFATKPLSELLKITAQDVHVPLYNVLLHYWIKVFSTDVEAVRGMSLVFFIATIPALFLLTREASNKSVAFLTTIFFTVSPFIIWFSLEARMYTLFLFITTVNSLYFLRFIRLRGKGSKLGLFLTSAAGFYTHYFFTFAIAAQLFYLLFLLIRRFDGNRVLSLDNFREQTYEMRLYIIIVLSAFATFSPWIGYFAGYGFASATRPSIPPPTGYTLLETFVNFVFGFQSQGIRSILISLWPLLTVLIFLFFTRRAKRAGGEYLYFIFYISIPILIVYLISLLRPIYLPRYFIFITPALFYLIALVFYRITNRIFSTASILLILLMFMFTSYQSLSAQVPTKENYRNVAEYLSIYTKPQDIIAVTAPFTVYPLEYYYDGVARIVSVPDWNRYEVGPIPEFEEETFARQIGEYRSVYRNLYFVFSYDQGYEDKIKEYMDSNIELLEEKEFGDGIEVRVYKLRYDN